MSGNEFKKHVCTCCGKRFIIGFVASWKFKSGTDWFCSYTCKAKTDRERDEERERKKATFLSSFDGSEARKAYMLDRNQRLIYDREHGMSLNRAAKKYGITVAQVKNICNSDSKEEGTG